MKSRGGRLTVARPGEAIFRSSLQATLKQQPLLLNKNEGPLLSLSMRSGGPAPTFFARLSPESRTLELQLSLSSFELWACKYAAYTDRNLRDTSETAFVIILIRRSSSQTQAQGQARCCHVSLFEEHLQCRRPRSHPASDELDAALCCIPNRGGKANSSLC